MQAAAYAARPDFIALKQLLTTLGSYPDLAARICAAYKKMVAPISVRGPLSGTCTNPLFKTISGTFTIEGEPDALKVSVLGPDGRGISFAGKLDPSGVLRAGGTDGKSSTYVVAGKLTPVDNGWRGSGSYTSTTKATTTYTCTGKWTVQ